MGTTTTVPNTAPETAADPKQRTFGAPQLITAMLRSGGHISDLIFSPGRAPQVEVNGQLVELKFKGLEMLKPEDTRGIAYELMGKNEHPIRKLEQDGSADLSYGISGVGRFRVNIFRQRGTCAIVMRVIPNDIPSFDDLRLPPTLHQIVELRNGIVLVTGPTGSGKSSTLAAILDKMNQDKAYHILTIEDPIEFLHRHKKATIHQRELHSDTPTFSLALRAALRQAPKVILVGEMRDRETIEIALEASETGHLVLSTLHTIDAAKTVERIVGVFPLADQQAIRTRLSKAFRFIVSQRLMPRKNGKGRIAAIEILKSTMRTREYVEKVRVKASRCWTPCAMAAMKACNILTVCSINSCARIWWASRPRWVSPATPEIFAWKCKIILTIPRTAKSARLRKPRSKSSVSRESLWYRPARLYYLPRACDHLSRPA